MAQHEVTRPVELLDEKGHIIEEGWARQLHWKYDRDRIKAPWFRKKEWDYYYVLSHEGGYGIGVTMSDLGYAGLFAIAWIDLKNRTTTQVDTMSVLPMGKTGFSPTSDKGDVSFRDKKLAISYRLKGNDRIITLDCPGFASPRGEVGLSGEIALKRDPKMDTMCIATSWKENRKAFYLNQKINCMPAAGTVKIGGSEYKFTPDKDFGALDWGRGVWEYSSFWVWASASGFLPDRRRIGLNMGYGFGDTSAASENCFLLENRIHKLGEVKFTYDNRNFKAPWTMKSPDGRLDLVFTPFFERVAKTDALVLKSEVHQMFGKYSGYVVTDEGEKLVVTDLIGWAEEHNAKW